MEASPLSQLVVESGYVNKAMQGELSKQHLVRFFGRTYVLYERILTNTYGITVVAQMTVTRVLLRLWHIMLLHKHIVKTASYYRFTYAALQITVWKITKQARMVHT